MTEPMQRYEADWMDDCHKPADDGECVLFTDAEAAIDALRGES